MDNCREWVAKMLDEINRFGKNEEGKGITRLAYSDADQKASIYIAEQMRKAGLTVHIDAIGNIIGRLEGSNSNAPAVASGSHLDTVPQGGGYDGVAGVIAALAAIKKLIPQGPFTHPLEMLVFRAEESSRFGFAAMGSKAMVGQPAVNAWSRAKDSQDISFAEALASCGYDFAELPKAVRNSDEIKAFIEMHIEQGRILEEEGLTIGVVQAIAAPTRLKVTVFGCAGHSGATPMYQRKDALVVAAELVLAVENIAVGRSYECIVATVGILKVEPGVMNVVPGLVTFGVDIRGVDYDSITAALQEFKEQVALVAYKRNVRIVIDIVASDKPVELSETVAATIEDACKKLNLPYCRMNSGAGHDAMNIASIAPAGMIFIPCKQGISHNPEEFASLDDICSGIDVLAEVMHKLAK